ncbi:putative capsular biosynthesis protein [Limosilactobacillus oris F0423]|nr:putative capsular biosynthesis protein [Limosilactobacillus oris F0423]
MTMYVITHKDFDYPLPEHYSALLVGANQNQAQNNYLKDNIGENISDKNASYCELTGIYWIWKNQSDSNVGISHYRRYFADYSSYNHMVFTDLFTGKLRPVSTEKLDRYLLDYDWIVAQPMRMVEPTVKEQFMSSHHPQDLKTTRKIIAELFPEYLADFDAVMGQSKASFYNMFYTTKKELAEYSKWLFTVLFAVEKEVDISTYSGYQKRLFGFLGERLLNVWLHHRQGKIKYLPVYNSSATSRIDAARDIKHTILRWN